MRATLEEVGRAIVELTRRPRPTWIIPWHWRIAVWLNRLWPGLVDYTTVRRFTIPERAAELFRGE